MADPDARNQALLGWYEQHRRSLPWRDRTDPWAVLVAEVMLQQTQASRVAERFGPFLSAFPTPDALAAAPLATVLTHWQGLGYPRRAVRLRQAAARIAESGWPRTPDTLRQLPGVGSYTAAAVACFAFGFPAPAVDTNLRRVLSRWEGTPLGPAEAARVAEELLDRDRPAEWNQALMDLGATVCRPSRPACDRCPVQPWCTDPDAYRPPRRQAPYDGSHRQARGKVLAALLGGSSTLDTLVDATGLSPDRVDQAVRSLVDDGLATSTPEGLTLADG